MDFKFEEWAELHRTNPEAFEIRRIEALRNCIDSADPAHKKALEHTLFKIEMTRRKSQGPLQAAVESSKLMWEAFAQLKYNVETLQVATKTLLSAQTTKFELVGSKVSEDAASRSLHAFQATTSRLHEKAKQDVAKVIQFGPRT